MKKVGIIILTVGLIATVITGFKFVTWQNVGDIGGVHIRADKDHNIAWSPVTGFVIMAIGGGFYLFGSKKLL